MSLLAVPSARSATTVKAALPPDNGTRVGICAAIDQDAGTITVTVAGTAITCGVLSSYEPTLGEPVAIIRERSSWLVLGGVRAGTATMKRQRIDKIVNSAAAGGGAGAVVLTMPSTGYPTGRVYLLRFGGLMFGSVANQGLFQVFRNSTAGTLLFRAQTPTLVAGAGGSITWETTGYFVNDSGATIVDTLVLNLTATAGTVTVAGSTTDPFWFEVQDWADPALYPNAIQL